MAANLHQKYQGHMDYNKFLEPATKGSKCVGSSPSPGFSPPATKTCKGSTAQCFPFGLEGNTTATCRRIPFLEPRGRASETGPAGRGRLGSVCAFAPTCVPIVPQPEILVGGQAVAGELDWPQLGAEDGLGRVNVDG